MRYKPGKIRPLLWLLLSVLAGGITWLYAHRVQGPWRYYQNVEIGSLKADLGDMYSPWVGTRELLRHGHNPYGPEVSHEIQMAYYGHALTQDDQRPNPSAPVVDEQRFAYPVYVVFLLAPSIQASFAEVQTWTLVILTGLTAVSVLLWLEVLCWRPARATTTAMVLFVLSSPQIVHGLRLRQLGLLVAFLLASAAWCITRNRPATAGIVLALSTIKPQMVVIPIAWFVLWSVGDWRKRWRLVASFVAALAALVASGELILPGWLRNFWEGLIAYRRYAHRESLLEVAFGPVAGTICAVAVMAGLLTIMWRNRKQSADSKEFAWTLALVLTGSTFSMPLLPAFNQVVLMLPALMVLRDWGGLRRLARFSFVITVSWPWLASSILLFLLPSRPDAQGRLWLVPSYGVLFVPFILAWLLMARTRGNLDRANAVPGESNPFASGRVS